MNPSIILVWVLGLLLAFQTGAWSEGWFHAKLLLVIILSGFHGWIVGYSKKLARGLRPWPEKRLRMINGVHSMGGRSHGRTSSKPDTISFLVALRGHGCGGRVSNVARLSR